MSKRILIAEDDLTAQDLMTTLARSHGYDVVSVANGVDLLTIAAKEKFDVIITDLMMADLDGAAATEIMKMQGNTTPVVALTGVSPHDVCLIQDKFTKIFYKPCNITELFEYIDSLIKL